MTLAVNIASLGSPMSADSSGNVGIGTSSPTSGSVLDVASGTTTYPRVRSTIGSAAAVFFQNSDTGTTTSDGMYVGITGAEEGVIWNNENTDLRIATNNTERMRIDSSGNLLVGGTSRNGTGRVEIKCTNGVDNGLVCYTTASGGATGTLVYFLYNNTTFVGSITSAGASTSYGSISDYRLKENVQPMTGALSKVAQLKPCTYKWKSNGSDGQGFIAHELQAVVPDAVVGEKDAVDSDENPVYQNIDTSFLVATLTAAIQELKAINDTQAETINALTARIVALEAK